MAFTLRVTQGAGEAEEFSFDGGEARMGRTADNDVVIKDPSSSRSHARVFEEDGRCFVEDLKSANGTTLNSRPLKGRAALESGDLIAIGDVVLEFEAATAGPSSTLDGEEEEVDPQSTILKPPSRPPSKPAAAVVRRPTSEAVPSAPRTVQRAAVSAPPPAAAPTAADRARERRELQRSTTGRAQLLWNELPRPTRIVVGIVGVAVTLGLLAALVTAVLPKRKVKRHEVAELVPNGDPIAESFGEGDDVDFSRPDMKSFTFSFAAPTAIVGVLHYQARDCGKDEVSIELNGTQVGTVPPDTVEVNQRQLEIVLPATQLKVNEPNEVVFDNVGNPPASDPWAIWNISVEVIPVPQLSPDAAAQRAKADLERAARMYELRGVGAMNLFRSWKQYRDAWLLLESTPDSPPELLQLARARMREIRPELDKKCASLLVSYQREMNQKYPNTQAARRVLQDVPSYFEKEHPCFGISRGLLANLEDLGEVE